MRFLDLDFVRQFSQIWGVLRLEAVPYLNSNSSFSVHFNLSLFLKSKIASTQICKKIVIINVS